ncbi:MAG TPA: hypothetical protein VEH77_15450 [Roseiarcus sp.]|nr:hypothetical protein [Roseiarcus sp.]
MRNHRLEGRFFTGAPRSARQAAEAVFAFLVALHASAHAQTVHGDPRPPEPAVYVGAVAGPTQVPQRMATSSPQMMSRTPEWANDLIAKVRLAFANFACCSSGIDSGPRNAPGAVMTVTASIEYPAGTCTPLSFAGEASGTAPDGGILISDMSTLPTPIPRGAQFWVRQYTTASGGDRTPVDYDAGQLNASAGERTAIGASVNDYTVSCAPPASWTEPPDPRPRKPLAVLGPTQRPSICLIGDSAIYGQGDRRVGAYAPDTHYGYIDRWVGRAFGTINLGVSADSLRNTLLPGGYTNRGSLLQYCTHAIVNYGVSDINYFSASAAQIEEKISAFVRLLDSRRKIFWYYTTMYPRSSVPENINQFYDSRPGGLAATQKEAQRQRFNSDLRAGLVTAVDAWLDPDTIAEQGPYTVNLPGRQSYPAYQGRFVTRTDTGYSEQVSSDGAHFNAAGTTLLDAVFSSAQGATPGVNNPSALFCRDKTGAYRC